MFIMTKLNFFWIWINILTPEELHQFVVLLVKGCGEFIAEGSYVVVNALFQVGHSVLHGFLGLRVSGRHGIGLGSSGGVRMGKNGLKNDRYMGDQDKERNPMG
jgi:hypothetical protein